MNQSIHSGRIYWVSLDNVRFKVTAIRPSALEGWWLCEGQTTGEPLMVPVKALAEAEEDEAA
jgi:hypothetical protein